MIFPRDNGYQELERKMKYEGILSQPLRTAPPLGDDKVFTNFGKGASQEVQPVADPNDMQALFGEDLTAPEGKARFVAGVESVIARGDDQITVEVLEDTVAKDKEFRANPDFNPMQAILVDTPDYNATEARYYTNRDLLLREATQAREQQAAGGTVDAVFDFIDRNIIRQIGIGTVEDLTDRSERRSLELQQAMLTMSPQEFKEYAKKVVQESLDEGVTKGNNRFAVDDLIRSVDMGGHDPMGNLNKVLALVDIVDIVGLSKAARSAGKAALRGSTTAARPAPIQATTVVGQISTVQGQQAGLVAGARQVAANANPQALGALGARVHNPIPSPVLPPEGAWTRSVMSNKITREIQNATEKSAFGNIADLPRLRQAAQDFAVNFTKNANFPVNTFRIEAVDEGLNTWTGVLDIGKPSDGTAYLPKADGSPSAGVIALANRAGGTVVPVDPSDLKKGYVVRVKERINTTGMQDPIKHEFTYRGVVGNTLGRVFGNSFTGSSATRDSDLLTTLAAKGEQGVNFTKSVAAKDSIKSLNKLNGFERNGVARVLEHLRDGPDAGRRSHYSREEFDYLYEKKTGQKAPERAWVGYQGLVEMEEASYLIQASNLHKNFVNKGFKQHASLTSGYTSPVKITRPQDIAQNSDVWDDVAQAFISKDNLQPTDIVYKLSDPPTDKMKYVINVDSIRELDPTDVMGYNPGGRRTNPRMNYFIVQDGTRLKSWLGAFSEVNAKKAMDELNTIRDAIVNGSSRSIDDIIAENNTFNPAIANKADLDQFMKDEGLDITKGGFGFKNRDGHLVDGDIDPNDPFYGMSMGDFIANDNMRNNRTLHEYGGARGWQADPVDTLTSQFMDAAHEYTWKAYNRHSIVGWVKAAKKDWLPDNVSPTDYDRLFLEAKVTGNDKFSRRMRELQDITKSRLNIKSDFQQRWEGVAQGAAEWVHGTTGKAFKFDDPTNAALKVNYHSAFGFFNPRQLFMQGLHSFNVWAIAGKDGIDGSILAAASRPIIRSAQARGVANPRIAQYLGLSVSDVEEYQEFLRLSARGIIDADAIEDGTSVAAGISSFNGQVTDVGRIRNLAFQGKKVAKGTLEAGLIPFKLGERSARLTSLATAFLEWKRKNPGVSALTPEASNWITRRDHALSFDMNTAARGKFQKGLLKIPTQWTSYSMRTMEKIMLGREFTASERARLALSQIILYGAAGAGAATVVNEIVDYLGIEGEIPENILQGLRFGMFDMALAYAGDWAGIDIALSIGQNAAPIGLFLDFYDKIQNEPIMAILGGPSGDSLPSYLGKGFSALNNLFKGHTALAWEDLKSVVRQPSGLDNLAKAYGIYNYGVLQTKTGVVAPFKMDVNDALIHLLGFSKQEVQDWYNAKTEVFKDSKTLQTFTKHVNNRTDLALQIYHRGDVDTAIQMWNEIAAEIDVSPFSPKQKMQLRTSIRNFVSPESQVTDLVKKLLTADKRQSATTLKSNVMEGY